MLMTIFLLGSLNMAASLYMAGNLLDKSASLTG